MKAMFSPKQEQFLIDDLARITLLYGSVRSGKTWISLLKWALWVGEQKENDEFLMVGKTLTTLKRNCFNLLENLVGDNFKYSVSQKKATLFGRTIWLEGANDDRAESKIRGMTLKGVYIDELTQIPEDFYLMALSRLSVSGAKLLATTNPDDPQCYVNQDIVLNDEIDKKAIKFLIEENIFLDPLYIENLKKEYKGVYYQRFILGEFVRAEGIIFPDFADNPSQWICKFEDVMDKDYYGNYISPNFSHVEVGFDLGGNGSAYALTCTGIDRNRKLTVLKSKKTQANKLRMEDVTKLVEDFCGYVIKRYNVRIGTIWCDHIDVIINSISDHTEYRATKCYKPPLEERPYVMSRLLAAKRIQFMENECDDLIDELRNLVYDDRSERAIPLDDGSMQIDTWDSWTYSVSHDWNYIDI